MTRPVLHRLWIAGGIAALGLVWRLVPLGLPSFWLNYGGSMLWGGMIAMIVGAGWRDGKRPWKTLMTAGTIALAAEFFRLYHQTNLDAFRHTLAGALLLGRVFNLYNIVAYGIGIAAVLPVHRWLPDHASRCRIITRAPP